MVQVSKNVFDLPGSKAFLKKKFNSKKKYINFLDSNFQDKNRSLKTILQDFYYNFKKKLKILWLAKNQIDLKMDVSFIMSKLLEIEKIKYLIFDSNQLFLFNLIPKPKIYNKKEGKPPYDDLLKNFHKRMSSTKLNISDYLKRNKGEKIARKIQAVINKGEKTLFDERLIKLLRDSNVIRDQPKILNSLENSILMRQKITFRNKKKQTFLGI
jgi:hypothetical protein